MEVRILTKTEVCGVYEEHMVRDFVENERKPLKLLLDMMDAGLYDPLGYFENGDFVGYTFLQKHDNNYLLDYFATVPEKRNGGIGSEILPTLRERSRDMSGLILEVEDPDKADGEEKALQDRRLNFYLRNGVVDSGVKVTTFHVPYRLLEIPLGREHTAAISSIAAASASVF